jgi:hypothetical protein
MNGKQDGAETDVDCGGGTCSGCADGKRCVHGSDCAGGMCFNNACSGAGMADMAVLQCIDGTANCDSDPANGCETKTSTDAKNCGACGKVCPPNTPACVAGICVPGHIAAAFDSNATWTNAEKDCIARGGHLVSEHSAGDNAVVQALCAATSGGPYMDKGCWIGMKSEAWVDGSALDYLSWSPNHDHSGIYVWQYLQPYPSQWDDQDDTPTVPYVCKLPLNGNTAGAIKTTPVP